MAVLGTDTFTHNQEVYSNARKQPQTQCCKINIEKCLPQPSMDVSYEKIFLILKPKEKMNFALLEQKSERWKQTYTMQTVWS